MTDQPISEQYRIVAKQWVDADAAAAILEQAKSATLSQKMMALPQMSTVKAEMTVKASTEWHDYIRDMVDARKSANLLKVKLEYVRMRFQENMSREATERSERRL